MYVVGTVDRSLFTDLSSATPGITGSKADGVDPPCPVPAHPHPGDHVQASRKLI